MGDLDLDSLDPRKATPGQVADLIAEVRRLTDLLHAKEAWIDGAKVDLDGYDEARAAIARAEALCDEYEASPHPSIAAFGRDFRAALRGES